jgi:hypothetical protein
MLLVKPATVIQWHRQGFRLYWQLAMYPGRSPERVGAAHLPNQIANLAIN